MSDERAPMPLHAATLLDMEQQCREIARAHEGMARLFRKLGHETAQVHSRTRDLMTEATTGAAVSAGEDYSDMMRQLDRVEAALRSHLAHRADLEAMVSGVADRLERFAAERQEASERHTAEIAELKAQLALREPT